MRNRINNIATEFWWAIPGVFFGTVAGGGSLFELGDVRQFLSDQFFSQFFWTT
jgi:hypothetical protein